MVKGAGRSLQGSPCQKDRVATYEMDRARRFHTMLRQHSVGLAVAGMFGIGEDNGHMYILKLMRMSRQRAVCYNSKLL